MFLDSLCIVDFYPLLFAAKVLKTLICVVAKDTRKTEEKLPWYIMRIQSLISPS